MSDCLWELWEETQGLEDPEERYAYIGMRSQRRLVTEGTSLDVHSERRLETAKSPAATGIFLHPALEARPPHLHRAPVQSVLLFT